MSAPIERSLVPAPLQGRERDLKEKIDRCIQQNDFITAWKEYTQQGEPSFYHGYFTPTFLPCEELIFFVTERFLNSYDREDQSLAVPFFDLTPDLACRCAIEYPRFREYLLEKGYHIFAGFPECLEDLAQLDSQFAYRLLTSERGQLLHNANLFPVFESAYPCILGAIEQNRLSDEEFDALINNLFRYPYSPQPSHYQKLVGLLKAIERTQPNSNDTNGGSSERVYTLSLLLGKFHLANICDDTGLLEGLNLGAISMRGVDALSSKVANLKLTDSFEKDLQRVVDLLLLPTIESPVYFSARFFLGNLFMDHENYEEAGRFFLQAAKAASTKAEERDVLKLAALSLVVMVSGNAVARSSVESGFSTLTPDECGQYTFNQLRAFLS